jgi:DNA (cytosine-5)-methyltransferase 1
VNRALDLFCGAGGATRGLQEAGYVVTGVDLEPQPRYVGEHFHQADAMTFPLEGYDLVWASPPCQRYSRFTPNRRKHLHPDLIEPLRTRLLAANCNYVIENVPCSPLRPNVILTGAHFGASLIRERWFETEPWIMSPPPVGRVGQPLHFGGSSQRRKVASKQELAQDMGIDWMTRVELGQAIPPAYSKWIGEAILARLQPA